MADHPLDAVAADALDVLFDRSPLFATKLGFHEHDTRVPDVSEAGERSVRDRYADCLARVEAVDEDTLGDVRRVQRSMLRLRLAAEVEQLDAAWAEFDVGVSFAGAPSTVLHATAKLELAEPGHAEAFVERCRGYATMLAQSVERLRAGVAKGRTPVVTAVDASIAELDEYFAVPLDTDPLVSLAGPPGWDGETAWREKLRSVVGRDIRPALMAYRDVLVHEVRPAARPAEQAGLCWLPGGDALYASAVAMHTTTARSPAEIHSDGLRVLAEIDAQVRTIAPRVLGTADLRDTFARLRDDASLRFGSAGEMVAAAERAIERAWTAAPDWFGRLPAAGCAVRAVLPLEAARAPAAYYQPPTLAGAATPGTYWLNTDSPQLRPRYDAEAMAFHEAVPGHHLQIATAFELPDVPLFLRLSVFTAYAEGWALYAELLADEMGLYSDDLQRLGLQSTRAMRACRLVVDTGMHHLGWTPERARAFCEEHTAWGIAEIAREVDRYVAWPGQALGYLVGCLEILRLRAATEQRLGPAFDVRGFHDVVLGHGSLPLATLNEIVDRWSPAPVA